MVGSRLSFAPLRASCAMFNVAVSSDTYAQTNFLHPGIDNRGMKGHRAVRVYITCIIFLTQRVHGTNDVASWFTERCFN